MPAKQARKGLLHAPYSGALSACLAATQLACRSCACHTFVSRRSGNEALPTLPVMATILKLLYIMAIAPYSRGGLLYGLPSCCQVPAGPRVLQCANQHRILQYLAHLAARQYTSLTLIASSRRYPRSCASCQESAKSPSLRTSPRRPPETSLRLLRRRRRLASPRRRLIRK